MLKKQFLFQSYSLGVFRFVLLKIRKNLLRSFAVLINIFNDRKRQFYLLVPIRWRPPVTETVIRYTSCAKSNDKLSVEVATFGESLLSEGCFF